VPVIADAAGDLRATGRAEARALGRAGEDRALTRATLPASMLPDDVAPAGLSAHAAVRIGEVYACVRVLVDAAASLPLHTYRRTPTGRVRSEGRLDALLARPAPGVTTSAFVGSMTAALVLHGDAFVGLYRDGDGQVAQLGILDAQAIDVRVERGELAYYLMTRDGVARLTESDVCHVRAPLPDSSGLRGLSPIRACAQTLGLARNLAGHAARFAASGARPGALVTLESNVSADKLARDGIRDEIEDAGSGAVLILGGGVKDVNPLTLSMVDAEFVAQRVHSAQEVARIFRVPPSQLGLPSGDSMTYSTVAEEARAFVRWSLSPWLRAIEEAISGHPDLSPSTQFVAFNLDAVLSAAPGERASFYESAIRAGWMTVDEVRRIEDLPQLPVQATDA
jgi:HK97 family phage portal protein